MLKLHTIRKHPKSVHRKKVVGRGLGSGHGTYSTRGGKGQTARTGHSKMPVGFEGGRQPLVRQVPKLRGFKSLTSKAITVPLNKLAVLPEGETVSVQSLIKHGIIAVSSKEKNPTVKLVNGELNKKLTVKVPVTASAKMTIEKAGGTVK
jgi:large subunit ribosomal protein L15